MAYFFQFYRFSRFINHCFDWIKDGVCQKLKSNIFKIIKK